MSKMFLSPALALLLSAAGALAQSGPGPGPVPDPWRLNGSVLSFNNGSITVPSTVTGGSKGAGTINAQGLYVNGLSVLSGFAATAPLAWNQGTATASLNYDSNFAVVSESLALASIASGNLLANAGASSAEPTATTPSAWLSRWCSASADQVPYASGPSTWTCLGLLGTAHTWTGQQTFVAPALGAATGTSLALGGATIGGNALAITGTATISGQFASTLSTGTAPFSVASTTMVANLYAARASLADTVTTNANLTGDVTSVGNATTLANIPTAVPMAGSLLATNIVAPATPAAGKTSLYVDSTQKVLSAKNDAGTVSVTVVPSAAVTNQFVTGVSAAGALTRAQPAFSDISGTIATGQVSGSYTGITGVGTLGAGATGAGFTVNFGSSTLAGAVPVANLPTGTAAAKGILQGDGSTLTITAGVIACTTATSGQIGCVRPDNSTITVSGGVLTAIGGAATAITVGTTSVGSGTTTRILYDNAGTLGEYAINGSGSVCMTVSCAMTTPTLGVATATTINKVAFTAPATGSTLTIADGKTLTASNSIALVGTDGTTWTGPSTNATLAALNIASQTLTGGANVTTLALTSTSQTINCGSRPLQSITNTAGFTLTAPISDGSCMILIFNSATAGAVGFSGFTVGSNTGDAITTTNGQAFTITIWRIGSISSYLVKALQ